MAATQGHPENIQIPSSVQHLWSPDTPCRLLSGDCRQEVLIMTSETGISVILSTWNRAEVLRLSLNTYKNVLPPDGPWELIVVDNNSTDHTREVVKSFAETLPVVYQLELKPGQCEARNCGIRNSRYPINLFTDDDITPCTEWLRAYEEAILAHPEASFFGGPVEPDVSSCVIPAWAQDSEGKLYLWVSQQLARVDLS